MSVLPFGVTKATVLVMWLRFAEERDVVASVGVGMTLVSVQVR